MTYLCVHKFVPVEGDDIFICSECGISSPSYMFLLKRENILREAVLRLNRATDKHLSDKGKGLISAIYVKRILEQALDDGGYT